MPVPLVPPSPSPSPPTRTARPRHYLTCEPRHFAVEYAINPWMVPGTAADTTLARAQWATLMRTYERYGHTVETVPPVPGLPDMVFAANAAVTLDGRVLGSRFHAPQRRPEAARYARWFAAAGYTVRPAGAVCEGEGDFVPVAGLLLAGHGFRTTRTAHARAQEFFGVPVVSLRLVDPRFYHLDVALFALDDRNVAYWPGAFSPGSRAVLRLLFPDAVVADEADALAFGLNSVSDGRHVFLAPRATGLATQLAQRGYVPVPVDLSELHKAGGGIKCCTQEIRPARVPPAPVTTPVTTTVPPTPVLTAPIPTAPVQEATP
ncbi:dimethylargininase [Streptomyces avicenniae]|uniref:dimethylargininase n=1 Tax=Streptomyces avicenniae TaxID=500153 RepID=UPI001CBA6A5F|nr:dimethylargininase [Streptomyces avicenniae]